MGVELRVGGWGELDLVKFKVKFYFRVLITFLGAGGVRSFGGPESPSFLPFLPLSLLVLNLPCDI